MTAQDLQRLRRTTQSLDRLLGLYLVPPGLAVLLVGAANALPSRGWNHWLVVGAVVLGLGSWIGVRNYYRRVVGGVVRRATRDELWRAAATAALLVVGSFLDGVLDPPLSLMLVAVALAFGLDLLPCGGRRAHFTVVLVLGSILLGPTWWGAGTAGGLATMAMGTAFIAAGLANHSLLDDALAPVGSAGA